MAPRRTLEQEIAESKAWGTDPDTGESFEDLTIERGVKASEAMLIRAKQVRAANGEVYTDKATVDFALMYLAANYAPRKVRQGVVGDGAGGVRVQETYGPLSAYVLRDGGKVSLILPDGRDPKDVAKAELETPEAKAARADVEARAGLHGPEAQAEAIRRAYSALVGPGGAG